MMITRLICLILLISIMIPNVGYAARKKPKREFPHGCREVGYSFKNQLLVLEPEITDHPQTIYLIKNIANRTIELTVERLPDQRFHPSFKNQIRYNQWAAFATDERVLQFQCTTATRSGEGDPIDCAEALKLCQYNRAKFADSNQGNYWVVDSDSLRNTVRRAIQTGILLRW